MDRRQQLKRRYKENPPSAGVFRITNTRTGKVFIGRGQNVQGILNSQRAQLKFNSHRNKALQADWKEFGEESFEFEILDTLDTDGLEGKSIPEELEALEALWLEKLKPFGEGGYN